ncbi:MAG: nucleotide-binding protein [Thermoproteota archaeon]|nr:nucleotide-binding protein [Thermoproteota archaeon]
MKNSDLDEYVLDANAFYAGLPFTAFARSYTTTLIINEVRHLKSSYSPMEALLEADKLRVVDPNEKSIKTVKRVIARSGDYLKLSAADTSVIALAYQLGITLISDDFAVENAAMLLGISIQALSTEGIRHVRKWISYCYSCGRAYGPKTRECLLCGNRLKRRFKRLYNV